MDESYVPALAIISFAVVLAIFGGALLIAPQVWIRGDREPWSRFGLKPPFGSRSHNELRVAGVIILILAAVVVISRL